MAVDISSDGYLYVDDLVRDRQESMSPSRLEGRYQDYLNVLVDRKQDGARELMVGTRWNVLDPLGRVEEHYKYDPEYRFRKIPALNENDESNFDYDYGVGFSSQYYIDVRSRLDKAEWMAKYQQKPFIREGLLFPEDELHYFDGVLPDGEYVVKAACDPAFGGGDNLSMPIIAIHENGKKYLIAWVYTKGTMNTSMPMVVDAIIRYNITYVRFEKNNGGELYARKVKEMLDERKYFHCKIESIQAPNKMPKEEKINAYSDYVKDNFIFLLPNRAVTVDDSSVDFVFKRDKAYDTAVSDLTMYTAEGKNTHDDAPDSLTQLAMIFENLISVKPTRMINSPI